MDMNGGKENQEKVPIGSRLPADLRLELDLERRRRGLKLEAALEEAITQWLDAEPQEEPAGPFGVLSAREERIMRGVLAYIRESETMPDRAPFVSMLDALGKRYAKKG